MAANDKSIVTIVTGICLISLAVVLKYILRIPSEIMSRDIILYIFLYFIFASSYIFKKDVKKSFYNSPLFWSTLIIIATIFIILVYLF